MAHTLQFPLQPLERFTSQVSAVSIKPGHNYELYDKRLSLLKRLISFANFFFLQISPPNSLSSMLIARDQLDLDHAELAQWLKTQNPYTNHSAARRKKQTNTGSWFLSGKQYGEWQCGTTPLLWIHGSRMHLVHLSLTLTKVQLQLGLVKLSCG